MADQDDILTDSEMDKLIMALADGQDTFSEEDARKLVEWAESVVINQAILNSVLSGKLVVSVRQGDEPVFRARDSEGTRG